MTAARAAGECGGGTRAAGGCGAERRDTGLFDTTGDQGLIGQVKVATSDQPGGLVQFGGSIEANTTLKPVGVIQREHASAGTSAQQPLNRRLKDLMQNLRHATPSGNDLATFAS